jgi:hypothetical protein
MEHGKPITLPFCLIPTIHPAMFYDDCSGYFNYVKTGNAGDFNASYVNTAGFNKPYGIRLTTRVTGPAIDDYASFTKYLWFPANKRMRLQLLFACPDISTDTEIAIQMTILDGTNGKTAQVQLGVAWNYVAVFVVPATAVQIPGARWTRYNAYWNYFDLSVDFSTMYYNCLVLNDQIFDLSTYPLHYSASPTAPYSMISVQITTKEAATALLNISDILLTPELR